MKRLFVLFLLLLSSPVVAAPKGESPPCAPPTVISLTPEPRAVVKESQIFTLEFSSPVDERSLERALAFGVEGIQSTVAAEIVKGEAREGALCEQQCGGKINSYTFRAKQNFPNDRSIRVLLRAGVKSTCGASSTTTGDHEFKVRKEFTVSLRCDERYRDGRCNPYNPIYLTSTEKLPNSALWGLALRFGNETRSPDRYQQYFSPELGHYLTFNRPFPKDTEFSLTLPSEVVDESGRSYTGEKLLQIKTGGIPPLVKFPSQFGILESGSSPSFPITVREVEDTLPSTVTSIATTTAGKGIIETLKALKNGTGKSSLVQSLALTPDRSFELKRPIGGKAFEVFGVPFTGPGFYLLETRSSLLASSTESSPEYTRVAVLVTDLAVHLKWGAESSLVWVTALSSGASVPGAEVEIQNCLGERLWSGKTDERGVALVQGLPKEDALPFEQCYRAKKNANGYSDEFYGEFEAKLIALAKKDSDLSFVLSSWSEGIAPWQFGIEQSWSGGNEQSYTSVLSRNLLRRGETAKMKHLGRTKSQSGFLPIPPAELPTTLLIRHSSSEDTFEVPLSWENGSALSEWKIPPSAKLGSYSMELTKNGQSFYTGAFSVEDYRVPLIQGYVRTPNEETLTPPTVTLDLGAKYLSGGAAAALPVKLRYYLSDRSVQLTGPFEGFVFGDTGETRLSSSSVTPRYTEEESEEQDSDRSQLDTKIRTIEAVLDKEGGARVTLNDIPAIEEATFLNTELELRDPNGEIQTIPSRIPLLPSKYLVGMKTDSWANVKDNLQFEVAVVNSSGKAQSAVPVEVRLFQREVYTARRKLLGGLYSYDNTIQQEPLGPICSGKTAPNGKLACKVALPLSGNFILEAVAIDEKGGRSLSASSIWAANGDEWWFEIEDSDRVDLIPEKKRYEPGELAKLQLRMPFKEGNILLTVEREGILDAFVTKLSRTSPVLELPIKPEYGPNIVISALAFRGRNGAVQPTSLVDLGKPAFKLGMTELQVGWKGYELKLDVKTNKEVYQTREGVTVNLQAKTADGTPLPAGAEVALAVIDEGLLELKKNTTWEILSQFMGPRFTSVKTATAALQVVGKRHFGLKALPFGGGGGKMLTRELFDTEAFWNGRVVLDSAGAGTVQFSLPDSLTSFRVVAIGSAGAKHFGTGSTSIRVTKDLMLLSGLSPTARTGDTFPLQFTVRNSTTAPVTSVLSGTAVWTLPSGEERSRPLEQRTVDLEAGAGKIVDWPFQIPADATALTYTVNASGGGLQDSLKVSQVITPSLPDRVTGARLDQLSTENKVTFTPPRSEGALNKRGGISVTASNSLTGSLAGVREYMKNYPFICLEQKLSKAIALGEDALWERIVQELPTLLDSRGFAKLYPTEQDGSDILTAYTLSLTESSGRILPAELRERMVDALRGFVEGRYLLKSWARYEKDDLLLRKLAALSALAGSGIEVGELVLAVAPAPEKLPTQGLVDLASILSHDLKIPGIVERRSAVERALQKRIVRSNTAANLDLPGDLSWQLRSAEEVEARLLVILLGNSPYKALAEETPKLLRGLLSRQQSGHWRITTANVWGSLALSRFASKFEGEKVTGKSSVTYNGKEESFEGESSRVLPWGEGEMTALHSGAGKPWLLTRYLEAVPLLTEKDQGFKLRKRIVPVEQSDPTKSKVGDLFTVTLAIISQHHRPRVVIEDPVPTGASILGRGLDRESALALQTGPTEGATPIFEERTFSAYRAYFDEIPAGKTTVSYTIRLNQGGTFRLPPSRVEAMYSPEVYGESPNTDLVVEQ